MGKLENRDLTKNQSNVQEVARDGDTIMRSKSSCVTLMCLAHRKHYIITITTVIQITSSQPSVGETEKQNDRLLYIAVIKSLREYQMRSTREQGAWQGS